MPQILTSVASIPFGKLCIVFLIVMLLISAGPTLQQIAVAAIRGDADNLYDSIFREEYSDYGDPLLRLFLDIDPYVIFVAFMTALCTFAIKSWKSWLFGLCICSAFWWSVADFVLIATKSWDGLEVIWISIVSNLLGSLLVVALVFAMIFISALSVRMLHSLTNNTVRLRVTYDSSAVLIVALLYASIFSIIIRLVFEFLLDPTLVSAKLRIEPPASVSMSLSQKGKTENPILWIPDTTKSESVKIFGFTRNPILQVERNSLGPVSVELFAFENCFSQELIDLGKSQPFLKADVSRILSISGISKYRMTEFVPSDKSLSHVRVVQHSVSNSNWDAAENEGKSSFSTYLSDDDKVYFNVFSSAHFRMSIANVESDQGILRDSSTELILEVDDKEYSVSANHRHRSNFFDSNPQCKNLNPIEMQNRSFRFQSSPGSFDVIVRLKKSENFFGKIDLSNNIVMVGGFWGSFVAENFPNSEETRSFSRELTALAASRGIQYIEINSKRMEVSDLVDRDISISGKINVSSADSGIEIFAREAIIKLNGERINMTQFEMSNWALVTAFLSILGVIFIWFVRANMAVLREFWDDGIMH